MHQEIHDWSAPPPAAHGRCTRARTSAASKPSRGGARKISCYGTTLSPLGLTVLTSDPLVELVYRTGLVSLRDLRVLLCCTKSEVSPGEGGGSGAPAASSTLSPC
jgi:hypothetical protein